MIIAFPHKPSAHGGPGSFQIKFENSLKEIGWRVVYPEDNIFPDIVLVLGGTRKVFWLYRLKKKNVPIIYRLGGINWLYEHKNRSYNDKLSMSLKLKILIMIQSYIADGIVYQSIFAKQWLVKFKQSARISNNVIIYNGVNTTIFKPHSIVKTESDISLLCVEGHIDYTPYAIDLLNYLQKELIEKSEFKSLILYGGFEDLKNREKLLPEIDYRGKAKRKEMPFVYKNAIFLSLDINATCPNTVLEALSSGIPVIGFDTGALKELVNSDSGAIVPYGSDPWKLNFPDADLLTKAAIKVLKNWNCESSAAREHALNEFEIEKMKKRYIDFIYKTINLKKK